MPSGKRILVLAAITSLWFFVFASGAETNQKATAKKEQRTATARGADTHPIAAVHQLPAVKIPVTCDQTIYLAGTEPPLKEGSQNPPPSPAPDGTVAPQTTAGTNPASAPTAPKIYELTTQPCDPKTPDAAATDLVLHLREGRLVLAPAPKQDSVKPAHMSDGTIVLVAAVALLALAALLYFLIYSFFFPTVQRLIVAEVQLQLKQTAKSAQTATDQGLALKTLAVQTAQQVMESFKLGDFRTLANRVERIESAAVRPQPEEPARSFLPPQHQKPTRIIDPPIVATPHKSGYEQFMDAYNAARIDPSVRNQFLQRYKPRNLEVTNTTDVLRSSSRPLFDWKPDGDLLAVDSKIIDKTLWPDGHYYLVPGYDKRWVSDRMKGGCWDYFFDVVAGNGTTYVNSAAVVKQDANLWQLADESNRGEIAWDPNAAS